MKKIILTITVLSLSCCAFAKQCFTSAQQRYIYEAGIASAQDNEQITVCLKESLKDQTSAEQGSADLASLKKSNNLRSAMPEILNIFKTSKTPSYVFMAASAIISAAGDSEIYQKQILDIVNSATAEDYKKSLAVIILVSMDAADGSYLPFLTPALKASDSGLAAYACGAYAILVPGTLDKYLSQILQLYTFDKVFAQKAFNSTGLSEKALASKLKEDFYSSSELLRLGAIEWIGDLGNKKLLLDLLDPQVDPKQESATLSAAANALYKNYALIEEELRKTLKRAPSSQSATVAVMAYSFLGSQAYTTIEPLLESGNDNETANALRVVSFIAGILQKDNTYYSNPALEKDRLMKLIVPVAKADKNASSKVKPYAQAATKELYNMLNR